MSFADFIELFGPPLLALAIVSISAPLVGVFLRSRGTAFHGVVLPQLATLGVSVGYALHPAIEAMHAHAPGEDTHDLGRGMLMAWAAAMVALGSVLLGRTHPDGSNAGENNARAAVIFVIASGLTIFAKQASPQGGLHVDALLSGETLAVMGSDVLIVGVVMILTVLMIRQRWRRMTLAGQDPAFAKIIGVSPSGEASALAIVTGLVVMTGVLSVGALPLFALLIVPAWSLGRFAPSMVSMLLLAPLVGLLGSAAGAAISFWLDMPMGASVALGLTCVALVPLILGRRR